ncbi:sterol desaturase family protein [Carboxylicivirga linearis]|uniref:Sterol desaturase family protein n=1 Tax=Carboxylicivirga linearis TaxID=1628157 RepID=A0ABS5JPV6_9BACT|nr:sterol desaturase family protein [Carboxylicivirga linearis]MBS2096919.1 sterol desaturase family protein [Carboxylicivirga linearis]
MVLFYILIVIATFVVMEGITWFTHKYVMHGFLWVLHEDHHDLVNETTFEKNDAFFIIFATPSILLFYYGINPALNFMFFIGLGIFFYGMAYFLVHDVFIHHRFNWLNNVSHPYMRGLWLAHKSHHKGGKCFGMLYVPYKFIKEAKSMTDKELKGSLI